MSKSVLLLGGSGFFGSALARSLRADTRFSVTVAGSSDAKQEEGYVRLDLLNDDLSRIAEFDIVVNLTGQNVQPFSVCHALNVEGMRNIINVIRSEQFFVQISTLGVYGTADSVNEQSPPHPETPYAKAKSEAEGLLRQVRSDDSYLLVRLCNLYGPNQNKGLPWYVNGCIRRNADIVIEDNDGTLGRFFLHADDAASMVHALIAEEVCGTVNVAGDERLSVRDIVALAERVTGRDLPARYGTSVPAGNIGSLDLSVLHAAISVRPKHTYEDFLRESLHDAI